MQPEEIKAFEALIDEMVASLDTLTQTQIDACAWAMGGSGCGWTKENIKAQLLEDNQKFSEGKI
jgi:hypothetical protein